MHVLLRFSPDCAVSAFSVADFLVELIFAACHVRRTKWFKRSVMLCKRGGGKPFPAMVRVRAKRLHVRELVLRNP